MIVSLIGIELIPSFLIIELVKVKTKQNKADMPVGRSAYSNKSPEEVSNPVESIYRWV